MVKTGGAWTKIPLYLGIGFAVTSWTGLILGSIGLLSVEAVSFVFVLLSLILRKHFNLPIKALKDLLTPFKNLTHGHPWLFYFALAYLLVRGFQTTLPQSHGDPLYYHLASAWQYQTHHALLFIPWAPWFLQGGLAELVYSMIGLWSGDRMLMMILAQGLHYFFAYPASFLVVMLLCRELRLSRPLSLIIGICALSFVGGQDALICAKNDGFVLFFMPSFFYATRKPSIFQWQSFGQPMLFPSNLPLFFI